MTNLNQPSQPSTGEFIALMALLMSMVALAIDAVLPAFHKIGESFQVTDENELQLIIGVLFLGLAIGQLLFGPLSDSLGRKPAIYIGLVLFIIGSLVSVFATDYDMVLYGRFLQGFGVAGPRTISIALVRDKYAGREMARIMSFVITVFILMPALAPALGQVMLIWSDWHAIFYGFIVLSMVALFWLALRQPETHLKDKRIPFHFAGILLGGLEVLKNRKSAGYMVVGGMVFGCLISYLNMAKLIYFDLYQIDELFPLYFAILALAIGAASIVNGQLVMKYGMRSLMHVSLIIMTVISFSFVVYLMMIEGNPSFVLFMIAMSLIFFFMGILFGNCNALAMEPMGHIAGIASSVIGAGTTFISMSLGTIIGQMYDLTLMPMVAGFTLLGAGSFIVMQWIEKKKEV
jgi:MFS transporter, DHA1 family, multidrug resistance protein